ncbi:hypothetical protein AKJ65_02560 [candidate division MSBL1 archaeon SCGC-AAA259E19]|uniref:Uncharacterized protein n=1 Tax=candidate division MSBL1 archaeon SCGC-AAA259E19 TaxID=1698264 RepID=A0A133ULW1_9EURY|nr:hypothetical protein AKJ65_02560 [candidate division MSBL1 archaeon SCGC-AAA259E19]
MPPPSPIFIFFLQESKGGWRMSKFEAECPVEKCNFRKESHWKDVAKEGVILHMYGTDGKGHGSRGSRPEGSFEIEVEEVEGE